jgi:ectoine hydroxylase-related dioxygenase (phytanoyl-CoA dioxygenase family)
MTYRLTAEQQSFFRERGYLIGLPAIYTPQEVVQMNADLRELRKLLDPGEPIQEIREWHEESRWLYDICMNPKILDLVEGLLGSDFFLWASQFFAKEPHSRQTVGWHQDSYYWPMAPHHSVTAWLAFTDVDGGNGAMRIVPGSHRAGVIQHQRSTQTDSILTLELEKGSFREDSAVALCLRAGEVSLHDDAAVHGSPTNPSDRWRIGLTIRYSGTDVKNDLTVNPHFRAYLCRGVDRYYHNPVGTVPTSKFGRLRRVHQNVETPSGAR